MGASRSRAAYHVENSSVAAQAAPAAPAVAFRT